jgi:hypothetical protein
MEGMEMENKIKASQIRAMQYWFADGLVELCGGVLCLMLAVYFGIQQILSSSLGSFSLLFLFVFVVAFGIRKLMLRYRQRSTYPRTGFIEPRKGWENRRLLGVEIVFTVLLLGFMLYTIFRGIQTAMWTPAICGALYAFIFSLAGHRTKLVRFIYLAIYSFLLGIILAFSGLGDLWGASVLSLCVGLVLLAFGIVTRATYLHQSSVIAEDADER